MNIGIVGAGIGGLTAAIALLEKGFQVRVLEKSPSFGGAGTGITLSPNALVVLRALGTLDAVAARGQPIRWMRTLTPSGKTLTELDITEACRVLGTEVLGIHRADLHRALVDFLPPENVTCNWEARDIHQDSDTVTVTNSRGEDLTFDLLLGADGIHSRTREVQLGKSPMREYGQFCWRGTVAKQALPERLRHGWHGAAEYWGPGKRFGYAPIHPERLYWFAPVDSVLVDFHSEGAGELRRHFGDWDPVISSILEATAPEDVIALPLLDRPPAPRWYEGRVAFLGDAIHPTTPNMGQGAAMAIESAWTLAHFLAKCDSHGDAFKAYARCRQSRTATVTNRSYHLGKIAQSRSRVVSGARNLVFGLMPAKVQQAALKSLFAGNPYSRLID